MVAQTFVGEWRKVIASALIHGGTWSENLLECGHTVKIPRAYLKGGGRGLTPCKVRCWYCGSESRRRSWEQF